MAVMSRFAAMQLINASTPSAQSVTPTARTAKTTVLDSAMYLAPTIQAVRPTETLAPAIFVAPPVAPTQLLMPTAQPVTINRDTAPLEPLWPSVTAQVVIPTATAVTMPPPPPGTLNVADQGGGELGAVAADLKRRGYPINLAPIDRGMVTDALRDFANAIGLDTSNTQWDDQAIYHALNNTEMARLRRPYVTSYATVSSSGGSTAPVNETSAEMAPPGAVTVMPSGVVVMPRTSVLVAPTAVGVQEQSTPSVAASRVVAPAAGSGLVVAEPVVTFSDPVQPPTTSQLVPAQSSAEGGIIINPSQPVTLPRTTVLVDVAQPSIPVAVSPSIPVTVEAPPSTYETPTYTAEPEGGYVLSNESGGQTVGPYTPGTQLPGGYEATPPPGAPAPSSMLGFAVGGAAAGFFVGGPLGAAVGGAIGALFGGRKS